MSLTDKINKAMNEDIADYVFVDTVKECLDKFKKEIYELRIEDDNFGNVIDLEGVDKILKKIFGGKFA